MGNNKYYSAIVATEAFQPGDVVLYYARISYSDHDTTFVFTESDGSATTADESVDCPRAGDETVTAIDDCAGSIVKTNPSAANAAPPPQIPAANDAANVTTRERARPRRRDRFG